MSEEPDIQPERDQLGAEQFIVLGLRTIAFSGESK
jgi:hypothetical protein